MKRDSFFVQGFIALLPVSTGVIPFGAVMGTVSHEAGLGFFQTMAMNILMYSGAAQLASVDLMSKHGAAVVVIVTGLIINLRFLLYSAAMSPILQQSRLSTKLFAAYSLTDQGYAVMSANQSRFKTVADEIQFYLGTAVCMALVWHASVIAGFVFGNFAPASLSLDFAIPISFLALVIPTIKNKTYLAIAVFSSVVSVLLHGLPFRTGLVATALLSIALGAFLTRKPVKS